MSCNKSSWLTATTSSFITERNRRVELDMEDEAKLLLALIVPPHLDYLDLDLDLMDALLFLNLDEFAADWTDFGEDGPRIEFL